MGFRRGRRLVEGEPRAASITVTVPADLMIRFDCLWKRRGYSSRSEMMREFIERALDDDSWPAKR